MRVKQISIFLENKSGRLARVAKVLGENGINIRALSIADTSDFGILRLIVNDPDSACKALRDSGFTVSETDVIAVIVPDHPGGLSYILETLDKAGVNIEYMYAFVGKTTMDAIVVFRVEDIDSAVSNLAKNAIRVLKGKEVYEM